MTTYKIQTCNGYTLYSTKIEDLPLHKKFVKPETLEKTKREKSK